MNSKTRQLKKIRIDSKENVELIFTEQVIVSGGESEESSREISNNYVVQGQYKPHKDLIEAMLGLRKFALDICEFGNEEKIRSQFTITTMVISGDMELQNSRVMFSLSKWIKRAGKAVNISTPQTMMYGEEYAQAQAMTKQIEKVVEEAWAYLGGKNGEGIQLSFSFENLKQAA